MGMSRVSPIGFLPLTILLLVVGCSSEPKTPEVIDGDCRREPERGTFEFDAKCCQDHPHAWGCY
jgi:hypothetical protein